MSASSPARGAAVAPALPHVRHRPESTILHAVVRSDLETMLIAAATESESGAGLPRFVEEEFRAYLDCGILANGFLRARCQQCGDSHLIAFSCKRRALCPSCAHRRMQDGAAHIVDHVLPVAPYRQWVVSYPQWLRLHLATDHALNSRVIALSLREIFKWQRRRARALGHAHTRTAAIAFLQRFGSALQLNPHVHFLLPDGVFGPKSAGPVRIPPVFIALPPPGDDEVAAVLGRIARKILALAIRLGLRERVVSDESTALARTIALALPPAPSSEPPRATHRSAFLRGFSLHANVFCHANDRATLARVVRYCLRPPFALDRMQLLPSGEVAYKMKRALPNGTKTLVLSKVDFLRRLASLVPPPRRHLTNYHGLFAPCARDRERVTAGSQAVPPLSPSQPDSTKQTRSNFPATEPAAPSSPASPVDTPGALDADRPPPSSPRRLPWAELLRRVHAVDAFLCTRCGGRRTIIAAVHDPVAVRAILDHLGLESSTPAVHPARPPPGAQLDFETEDGDPFTDPPSLFS